MAKLKIKRVTSNPVHYLKNSEEIKSFFKEQKETDVWQKCRTNEISVLHIPNNPIMVESEKEKLNMENVSDLTVTECMETHKICVRFPTKEKMLTFPIRDTCFVSLCKRAGIGGRTLSCIESKKDQKELPTDRKATIFSWCLEMYSNKSLVLIRDDAVSAVLSGDEADYQRMPMIDLINYVEDSLSNYVSDFNVISAECDYEIAKALYRIEDKDIETALLNAFRGLKLCGNAITEVLPYVLLVTSDIGISGANLYPCAKLSNGEFMFIGKGLKTEHLGANAIANFKENCNRLYALFVDNTKKIAELKTIRVKNAGGCARNIACMLKFPKKESIESLEYLDSYTDCTAFDVYCAIFGIIDTINYNKKSNGKELSNRELLDLQESASEVAYLDFKRYDFPFEWKS